ncbi:hypothetical protein HAX54_008639 [Datura stramonium]|uniref:Uncharacterized protein n=1 Tax=Datura stramonium TaxID=4076 RepID=A0ABS8TDJ2_DATST|nr:hypothetical protein [Datura stramonium]
MGYWPIEALSKEAIAVGRPLYTDNFMVSADKISYARILIEVDVSQTLVELVQIETPTRPWMQVVDNDWCSKFCNDCLMYGYDNKEYWYKTKVEVCHSDIANTPEVIKGINPSETLIQPVRCLNITGERVVVEGNIGIT